MGGTEAREDLKKIDIEVGEQSDKDAESSVDLKTIFKVQTVKPIDYPLPQDMVGD